jgi:hypothetical protein
MIGTWKVSKMFTVDRTLRDLFTIKISAIYNVPFGQKCLLKNELFIKISILQGRFSSKK